jgi:diaminopimelate decarboxylase
MSMWSKNVSWSTDGELSIAGISASRLASEFGTPLFVLDEDDFRTNARHFKSAFEDAFGVGKVSVYYAGKAFISASVAQWLADDGINLDVCTGGELAIAQLAKFPPSRIEFHGNNKSVREIEQALDYGVDCIALDSFFEIDRVEAAAAARGIIQKVIIRTTPGVEAHTHEFIATAHEDVKFGFSISSGAALEASRKVRGATHLDLQGLHAHIGSQIFDTDGYELAAKRIIALLSTIRDESNAELPHLDIGGGFGIAYLAGESALDPGTVAKKIQTVIAAACEAHGLKVPHISIEPGRAIAGPSMSTLYEVGTTKMITLESGGSRHYIAVDGGMSDNMRPALYDAEYTVTLANRSSTAALQPSRVVGKHCESGDIIIKNVDLPSDIVPGDLLVTPVTGAYGRSMASNYNHISRPPVVAVNNGKARIIVRRETHEDLLRLENMEG